MAASVSFVHEVYRNGLTHRFVLRDDLMTHYVVDMDGDELIVGDPEPMSWDYWSKGLPLDLKEQGFSFLHPDALAFLNSKNLQG